MPRIIHIGPDSQFVQFAADSFERTAPGSNDYVIVTDVPADRLRHPIRAGSVRVVSPRIGSAVAPLIRCVRRADVIVAHAMTRHAAVAFAASRRRAVRVWSGWGYEYYGSDADPNLGLLEPLTSHLMTSVDRRPGRARGLVEVKRRIYRPLIHRAAALTDVFSAPVPGDLEVLQQRFPQFSGIYSQICYASVERSFSGAPVPPSPAKILVGNSSSPTGNHLDVFADLIRMDLSDRTVVVPLSYGDSAYRSAILAQGERLLGARFHPLVEHMPLAEYNTLIGSCGVVVMNHIRQQALGNIGLALYGGAHVALNEKSPVFSFLRSRGAVLMSISELRERGLPRTALPPEDVVANRRVLREFWGADRVLENTRSLVREVDRLLSQRMPDR